MTGASSAETRVPRRVIAVFAKRPEPGAVKTRMCPPLTPDQAARLYAAMLDDVLATTAQAARAAGATAWLLVHPPDAVGALSARAPEGFRALRQRGDDLAERMANAVVAAARDGFDRILLRGSDSPSLPVSRLVDAFALLDRVDVAVGPDRDGGYGWIGLRAPVPGLFDHPMSTASVLDETLANATARGLRTGRGEGHFDLDRIEDLAQLAADRHRGAAAACPRTLARLDAEDLWRHLDTRVGANALDESGPTR